MTTTQQKQGGNIVGIVTMIFLFGMIGFVTNLAAPIGTIWNGQFASLGMLGNLMNFVAYLFMGIPAGKLLTKIGYKKTALAAIAIGLVGIFVQFLSGKVGGSAVLGFSVYLAGAFIAGLCVCLLNTVVNPMLNLLAGAGNKGNQMIQIGGSFNSLMGTLAPMVVMAMVGEVVGSSISQVDPVLYLAMGVFALTFVALLFIPLKEIHKGVETKKFERSPWAFRHFVLGAVAIFVYVGVEVGIPGTILYWFSDTVNGAGLPLETAAGTAGVVAAMYWLLMLVGRFLGGVVGGKVSSRAMMICATGIAALLVFAAIIIPSSVRMSMPAFSFTGGFSMVPNVPLSALLFVLCGLCTSVMWGAIFNLATEGLGKYIPLASGIFMMMVVGGGIIPFAQQQLGRVVGYLDSYWLPLAGILYMFFYAVAGCKNVNKDIKVD
ncbi:MAG: MFS transporter [Rikenellaceae bacterium]|jgi:FHS family L-fucose permease-like MFS transporter|nr:MFS transporter [Rikenellaceae bacterium]